MVSADNVPAKILKTLDPDLDIESMDPYTLQKEAEQAALFAAEELRRYTYPVDLRLVDRLNDRQIAQYAAQRRIAQDNGRWHQGHGADGCDYKPDFKNDRRTEGIVCQHCAHYDGEQTCEVVEGNVHPDGICRFWIIPDDLVRHRVDSERTDGHTINWNGLTIGITHTPGMTRFSGGPPMRASYGRIYGSYGKAEDGKAIDVYVKPGFDPSASTAGLYRVRQRDPETGMEDETKYMLGYENPIEARQAFTYHAGVERFGSIAHADVSELAQYQQAVKPRRGRKKKAEAAEATE